jgi:hypothetical protein
MVKQDILEVCADVLQLYECSLDGLRGVDVLWKD